MILDKMLSADKKNPRINSLITAFEETIQEIIAPIIERYEKLGSFWTADESDLKYILRKNFGDHFGDLTNSIEDKRVYLWGISETPYYKTSTDIFKFVVTRLNLTPECVMFCQYYWDKNTEYIFANYSTAEDIEVNGGNIENYVALSEILIRFDEYNLTKSGLDAESAKEAIEKSLKKNLSDHVHADFTLMRNVSDSLKSLVYADTKQIFQTVTL